MSFLRSLGILVCRLYGDEIPDYSPVEKWALKNANLCSADDIISAAVIKSIATSYDDWVYTSSRAVHDHNHKNITMKHTIRDVTVTITWSENTAYIDMGRDTLSVYMNFKINDISVSDVVGTQIKQAYMDIKEARAKAKRVADAALAEQKRIEAAWQLAEGLLGMRRNKFGALVPVTTKVGTEDTVGEIK